MLIKTSPPAWRVLLRALCWAAGCPLPVVSSHGRKAREALRPHPGRAVIPSTRLYPPDLITSRSPHLQTAPHRAARILTYEFWRDTNIQSITHSASLHVCGSLLLSSNNILYLSVYRRYIYFVRYIPKYFFDWYYCKWHLFYMSIFNSSLLVYKITVFKILTTYLVPTC